MLAAIYELHYLRAIPRLMGRMRDATEDLRLKELAASLRDPSGKRSWARHELGRYAWLEVSGAFVDAQLLDVSAGGFRVALPTPLPRSATVELVACDGDGEAFAFPCRIRWVNRWVGTYGLVLGGLPRRLRPVAA